MLSLCFQSAGLYPDRDLHPGVDVPLLAALHLPVPRPAQLLGPSDQGTGDIMVMLNKVQRSNTWCHKLWSKRGVIIGSYLND